MKKGAVSLTAKATAFTSCMIEKWCMWKCKCACVCRGETQEKLQH